MGLNYIMQSISPSIAALIGEGEQDMEVGDQVTYRYWKDFRRPHKGYGRQHYEFPVLWTDVDMNYIQGYIRYYYTEVGYELRSERICDSLEYLQDYVGWKDKNIMNVIVFGEEYWA